MYINNISFIVLGTKHKKIKYSPFRTEEPIAGTHERETLRTLEILKSLD
jgi:hypothetical protein